MISSYQTKRIASFFIAILLVISMSINFVSVAYAAETERGTSIPLDKYSFLETVCSMFNFLYIPEEYLIGELVSWDDISKCSSNFDFLLTELNSRYVENINTYGYQSTNELSDNYVRPYFYNPTNSSYKSIYNTYLQDGCLDFSSSLNDNEFVLIRESINNLFKLMYDYNYNLSDYTIEEISYSVPKIEIYTRNKAWMLGYNIPFFYKYTSTNLDWSNTIGSEKDWIDSYSSDGFQPEDYLWINCVSPQANGHFYFNLGSVDTSSSVGDMHFSCNNSYVLTIDSTIVLNKFQKTVYNENSSTVKCYETTIHTSSYSNSMNASAYLFISPLFNRYTIGSYSLPNWGKNMIIGTAEAWDKYSSFTHTSENNIFYPPTVSGMNELLSLIYQNKNTDSAVDIISGVDTSGEKTPVVEEEEEFVFDYEYIDKTIDDAIDQILNSGNYDNANESLGNLDDALNNYYEVEDQLKDFTNLDNVVNDLWNVNNLVENATNISTVSTFFMTLWNSFGPFIVVFSLALSLGLVAFLLKLRN